MFGRSNLHLVAKTFRRPGYFQHLIAISLQYRFFRSSSVCHIIAKTSGKPNRFASKYDQKGDGKPKTRLHAQYNDGSLSNNVVNQVRKAGNGQSHSFKNQGKFSNKLGGSQIKTRTVKFNFNTGSEKAKAALKAIITKVQQFNTSYKVNFVSPESNKLTQMHLVDIVNTLDLDKNGLLLIDSKSAHELPLIRLIKVQDMVKEFSDKLAAIKEKELLELGSFAAQRAINQRLQAEKKKSATKILTLSWSISVSDLVNQKKNEIMKRVNKGEKFIIFIGEKSSLYSARNSSEKEDSILKQLDTSRTKWDRMDEDELTLELNKRELVMEKLKELLDEAESKYEVSGNLDARMMLNVSPKPKSTHKQETELTAKEAKRLKKQTISKEKENTRTKIDEDDLDSLYLFKIEN